MVYQVYPRSFADANGDGVGDLLGLTNHIPYISELGVDAIWLSPFYPSAGADAGYDVSDPCAVDPMFGTIDDFDRMLDTAHASKLRVLVDLVPNHTSSEHRWFREALASPAGSVSRNRYIFRPGRNDGPPNDWESVFGGSAWTQVAGTAEWYLHLFDAKQPDLNWRNQEVRDEYRRVLQFWLDRGVDGFRVDVAHGLIKANGLPDVGHSRVNAVDAGGDSGPMWDQDEVHDIYREWRLILADYDPERILVAEAWAPRDRLSQYIRPDEMHQAFNFDYLAAGWDIDRVDASIDFSLATTKRVNATTTWVLSNHDVVRVVSRLGREDAVSWTTGIGPNHEQPDVVLGGQRARALALLTLALPGSVYVYQGEELGLPDHTNMPNDRRLDPSHRRTSGEEIGRDGCRVPLPWVHNSPGYGFGPDPWLPQPASFQALAIDLQDANHHSFLNLYRTALRLRREHSLGLRSIRAKSIIGQLLRVETEGATVVVNFGSNSAKLHDSEMNLMLESTTGVFSNGLLAANSAIWLRNES